MAGTPRRLVALAPLILLAACDLFGPDDGPTVGPPMTLHPTALLSGVGVGDTVTAGVTAFDAVGKPLPGIEVTWTPSLHTAVEPTRSRTDQAGTAVTRWALGTVAGERTLVAAAGDLDTTFTVMVSPGPLRGTVMSPGQHAFDAIGDTVVMTAHGQDAYGNPIEFRTSGWRSSDSTVAAVDSGTVVSRGEGEATITATWRAFTATAGITVDQALMGIAIRPGSPVTMVDDTMTLRAVPVDRLGSPVDTSLTVAWSSSDDAVATIDETGTVRAVATGSTTIRATAGSLGTQATLRVLTGPRPTLDRVAPGVLSPGDTAVFTGSDFGTDPGLISIDIGGVRLDILEARDTAVTALAPPVDSFPCAITEVREISLAVDGLATASPFPHPVAAARRHALPVGGSVALFGTEVACNEVAEPGDYLVTVFNTHPAPGSRSAYQLRGTGTAGEIGATAPLVIHPDAPPDPPSGHGELARRELAHLRLLEGSGELVEGQDRAGRRAPFPALTVHIEPGDLRSFRIPDVDGSNYCGDYIEVTARAVHVGDYAVVWEDVQAPLAGTMDETWTALGREYDTVMHPLLLEYFGSPLAFDSQLDGNGGLFMLFSPTVNDFSIGLNGFVLAGDFYSRDDCASSDEAEIFYGQVATSSSADFEAGSVREWAWGMRATIIHEVKHLVSFATRFDLDPIAPNLEATGLEEATARMAEELYGRTLMGFAQLGNTGFQESIGCELVVTSAVPACEDVPLVMGKHYAAINAAMKTPEYFSPLGPTDGSDWTYYGTSWQFLRWVIDHSGAPEQEFLKQLVREPVLTGPANIEARAGRPLHQLIADYSVAVALDDLPSGLEPVSPVLTLPSWDTRDIFAGLHDHHADTELRLFYDSPWPLGTRSLIPGDFTAYAIRISGGATSVFELDDVTAPQLLQLLAELGGIAPAVLGLAITRTR